MKSALLATLLAVGYAQSNVCMYTANDGQYTLNLTQISGWTLEYESPGRFFYYTPCRFTSFHLQTTYNIIGIHLTKKNKYI